MALITVHGHQQMVNDDIEIEPEISNIEELETEEASSWKEPKMA